MIHQFLYVIDVFKVAPQFLINEKPLVSSKISQFLSILLLIFGITIFRSDFNEFISKNSYSIQTTQESGNRDQYKYIDKNNVMFAIKVGNKTLMDNFFKYFDIFYITDIYETATDSVIEENTYPLEICTKDHFPHISESDYNDSGLNSSFCIPKNMKTKMIMNNTQEASGSIIVKNCNIDLPTCVDLNNQANYDEFMDIYKTDYFWFTIQSINVEFHLDHHEDPTIQVLDQQYLYFSIMANQYHILRKFVSHYEIQQDFSILFQNENVQDEQGYLIDNKLTFYQNFQVKGIRNYTNILRLFILYHNEEQFIKLSYENFPGLFIKLYGSIKGIMLVFGIVSAIANKNYLKIILAKKLFGLDYTHTLKSVYHLYQLDKQWISVDKIRTINKYLDFHYMIKDHIQLKILKKSLISKPSKVILELVQKKSKDLNHLNQHIENQIQALKKNAGASRIKANNYNLASRIKTRQSVKNEDIIKDVPKSILYPNKVNDKKKISQSNNFELKEEIKPIQNDKVLKDFLLQLGKLNTNNLLKCPQDILIQIYFNYYLEKRYQIVQNYDYKEKVKNYQHMLQSFIDDEPEFNEKKIEEEKINRGFFQRFF